MMMGSHSLIHDHVDIRRFRMTLPLALSRGLVSTGLRLKEVGNCLILQGRFISSMHCELNPVRVGLAGRYDNKNETHHMRHHSHCDH